MIQLRGLCSFLLVVVATEAFYLFTGAVPAAYSLSAGNLPTYKHFLVGNQNRIEIYRKFNSGDNRQKKDNSRLVQIFEHVMFWKFVCYKSHLYILTIFQETKLKFSKKR